MFDDVGGGEFAAGFEILMEGDRNSPRSRDDANLVARHALERIKRIQQTNDNNEKTEKNDQKNSFVHPRCHRMVVTSFRILNRRSVKNDGCVKCLDLSFPCALV